MTRQFIRILENDDFVVDYDKWNNQYRVSYFEDYHFKEECYFDAYELKALPEKYEVCGEFTYENMWGADEKWAFEHGWNACLKEILGK